MSNNLFVIFILFLFSIGVPICSASQRKARWVDSIFTHSLPRGESGLDSEGLKNGPRPLKTESEVTQAHQMWARESFTFIRRLNCGRVHFTTRSRCFDLIRRSMSSMNMYIGDPADRLLDDINNKSADEGMNQSGEISDQSDSETNVPLTNYEHIRHRNGTVQIDETNSSNTNTEFVQRKNGNISTPNITSEQSHTSHYMSVSRDGRVISQIVPERIDSGRSLPLVSPGRDQLDRNSGLGGHNSLSRTGNVTNTTSIVTGHLPAHRRTRSRRSENLGYSKVLPALIRRKRFLDFGSPWPSSHSEQEAESSTDSRSDRTRRSFGRVHIVLPNGELKLSHHVDAVVVIDPYPEANFGHLVLIFTVTHESTRRSCRDNYSIFIEATDDCMRFVVRHRCRNILHRRNRRRNFDHRCEINFIPLVYLDDNASGYNPRVTSNRPHEEVLPNHRQLLRCRTYLNGFSATCPELPNLSRNGTRFPICNPTRNNTYRCQTSTEVLRPAASMRCLTFETCDEAVLISGSWNEWTERKHHEMNLDRMSNMLLRNGFRPESINIFHIDGLVRNRSSGDSSLQDFHPARYKPVFRYHIQNLCRSPHCVDTLVIYLNSPALPDGSSLLWDSDGDGVASDAERYTVEELKTDLSYCQARHVHVITDESYAGEMTRVMRRSASHRNVAVYTSGRDTEYSTGNEFTEAWSRADHTSKCMTEVFREARRSTTGPSRPQMLKGPDAQNVNIFGAPCSVTPPFTRAELQENYLGCQKLPSAIWAAKLKYILSRTDHDAPTAVGSRFLAGDSRPRGLVLDDADYDELQDDTYDDTLDFR